MCHICTSNQDTPISIADLSALTRLSGPCCLVLQSFQVESILPMAIQANKLYKNPSLMGKWHVIHENSELNKYSYLLEYSW